MKSFAGQSLGNVLESVGEKGRDALRIENGSARFQGRRDALLEQRHGAGETSRLTDYGRIDGWMGDNYAWSAVQRNSELDYMIDSGARPKS